MHTTTATHEAFLEIHFPKSALAARPHLLAEYRKVLRSAPHLFPGQLAAWCESPRGDEASYSFALQLDQGELGEMAGLARHAWGMLTEAALPFTHTEAYWTRTERYVVQEEAVEG